MNQKRGQSQASRLKRSRSNGAKSLNILIAYVCGAYVLGRYVDLASQILQQLLFFWANIFPYLVNPKSIPEILAILVLVIKSST